jgi:sialidase-1
MIPTRVRLGICRVTVLVGLTVGAPLVQEASAGAPPEAPYVIVDDGGPGRFAAWPDLVRLADNTLLCCFYHGYAHGSAPSEAWPNCGRLVCVRSDDGGKTWSAPQTMVDSDGDDHDGHLTLLRDGRILCNYFSEQFYRDENGRRVRVEGKVTKWGTPWRIDVCLIESSDKGLTWSQPRRVPTCWDPVSATADSILELSDGGLLMPVYGWNAEGAEAGVGVTRSQDGGQSWGPVTLMVGPLSYFGDGNEMSLARTGDGRLLALVRPKMFQCYSSDEGQTWTKPVDMGMGGHAPRIMRTRSGVLVCGIRIPAPTASQCATGVIVSRDEGATWQGPYQVDSVTGAYPGMVELPDGSIYMVYYEEGSGSRIRGMRFRLREKGVEPIAVSEWR